MESEGRIRVLGEESLPAAVARRVPLNASSASTDKLVPYSTVTTAHVTAAQRRQGGYRQRMRVVSAATPNIRQMPPAASPARLAGSTTS